MLIDNSSLMNLNSMQKSLLKATLSGEYGTLTILRDNIDLKISLVAFAALLSFCDESFELYHANISLFETHQILPIVNQVTDIILHPAPQNRSDDYPYFGKHPIDHRRWVVYKDSNGGNSKLLFEVERQKWC